MQIIHVPATIPRTSVALCLTVASESFNSDFKLAPMPGNKKNSHWLLILGCGSLSKVHITGEDSSLSLELHVSRILVNGCVNYMKVIIVVSSNNTPNCIYCNNNNYIINKKT